MASKKRQREKKKREQGNSFYSYYTYGLVVKEERKEIETDH